VLGGWLGIAGVNVDPLGILVLEERRDRLHDVELNGVVLQRELVATF